MAKSKKAKKAGKAREATRTISLKLPKRYVDETEAILNERGVTLEKFLCVAVMSFRKTTMRLGLDDIIDFGKYNGIKMEDAVRIDPSYFQWLLSQNSKKLGADVIGLLGELTTQEDISNMVDVKTVDTADELFTVGVFCK